jgi:hypothetical protein
MLNGREIKSYLALNLWLLFNLNKRNPAGSLTRGMMPWHQRYLSLHEKKLHFNHTSLVYFLLLYCITLACPDIANPAFPIRIYNLRLFMYPISSRKKRHQNHPVFAGAIQSTWGFAPRIHRDIYIVKKISSLLSLLCLWLRLLFLPIFIVVGSSSLLAVGPALLQHGDQLVLIESLET